MEGIYFKKFLVGLFFPILILATNLSLGYFLFSPIALFFFPYFLFYILKNLSEAGKLSLQAYLLLTPLEVRKMTAVSS